MKRKVSHHSSVIILEEEGQHNFMFHVYDDTYPRVSMRNRANLIGGNFNLNKKTHSPEALLDQELIEEFSIHQESSSTIEESLKDVVGEGPGAPKVAQFAPERDIALILGTVLMRRTPYQDFLYHIPSLDGKPAIDSIVSAYHASIPQDIFGTMRNHIAAGRGVRNEGFTLVTTADDLRSGKVPCAWHTGRVMENYLKTSIPDSYGVIAESFGMPRQSFQEYLKDLEYTKPVI